MSIKDKGSAEVTPFTPSQRSPDEESLVGHTIGKYEILGVVGQGGMGRVYEALNTTIKKRVAIKCIDNALATNDEANERFQREALAASAIESQYIVQIFDAGKTPEGFPFIVMEMLRGQDLGKCITEHGHLQLGDALHFTAQILKGLHHAHQAGIIHRDLKPDNVFLVDRDEEMPAVKLLDFGVSKIARSEDVPLKTLTRQGTVVGTPYYMSPEQAQAMPDVDARTDIYSVGAILFECLSGRPPHAGHSYEQVIVNICMKDAEDIRRHCPSVPEGIAKVIATALARDRKIRYESARAMLEALRDNAPSGLSLSSPSSDLVSIGSSPGLRDSGAKRPSSGARIITGSGTEADADGEAPTQIMPSTPPSRPAVTPAAAARTPAAAEQAAAELADTVTASSTVRSADLSRTHQGRRWPLVLAAGAVLLLGGAAYLHFTGSSSDQAGAEPTAASGPAGPSGAPKDQGAPSSTAAAAPASGASSTAGSSSGSASGAVEAPPPTAVITHPTRAPVTAQPTKPTDQPVVKPPPTGTTQKPPPELEIQEH